ncbi:MAG: YitT family protein [Eubacteriales bacterium]|nr:YitT family protein [Eubacteriales bacterium]
MLRKAEKKIITLLMVIFGNLLYALTVRLFLLPAGLATGGSTGIALAVHHFTGFSVSGIVLIFNVGMLLLGLLVLGRQFAMTTVISTFVYPVALNLFDRILGGVVISGDIWLCTIFSGLGIGASLGIVIRAGASTGGMDIPPLVLNHYFRIPVSVSMYVFDVIILLFQLLSNPPEKLLYSIVLILVYTMVLDKLMLMGTTRTEVRVVSTRYDEIREKIIHGLDRGVTMMSAETGYMGEKTQMIFSVISNRELPKLEKVIREIDPHSFMVVNRVSEVSGRGFTDKKEYRKREEDLNSIS